MSEEPVRLRLDPSCDDELRASLEAARADHHDDERLGRLAARLGPLLTPPGGGGGSGGSGGGGGGASTAASSAAKATSATSVASGSGLLSAAKGLALIAALGAAGTFVWVARTPPSPIPATAPPVEAPSEPPVDTLAPSVPETHVETPLPRVTVENVEDTRRRAQPRPPSTTTTRAPTPTTTTPPEEEPGEVQVAPTTPPPTELALVRGAMRALATSPAAALAQAEEHARLYPDGAMQEDREVIAIDALVRLDRRAEAEARAARFRAAHPSSPLLRRIDRILAP